MRANHVRQRLSNIQQSYPGHMDLMIKELEELERLARIGKATEFAMQDGSKHTVFAKGIDYLLEFYYRESEELNDL